MKRVSKADIYREYGIEYKDGSIYYPGLDRWINPLLVNGNEKIGLGVYHFSTLPGTAEYHININFKRVPTISKKTGKESTKLVPDTENACVLDLFGTCICDCANCYAMTGNYCYDTTLAALAIRTLIMTYDLDFFTRAIMAQIKADNIQLVRIHASGDFKTVEYIEAWKEIVKAFPKTVFWSYTKNAIAENAFNEFTNCNIVKSRLPDFSVNYGTCREIMDKYAMLLAMGKTVYICRCGMDKDQHCVNCTGCSKYDYVLFLKHGDPSYNAEKDPLYTAFVALVESQDKSIAGIK